MEEQRQVEIVEFTSEDVSLGVKHAAEKYGLKLNGIAVRLLANRILTEMREYDQTFETVRKAILEMYDVFPWSENAKAWHSALGKIFSLRRVAQQKAHARRGLRLKKKVSPRFLRIPKVIEQPDQQLAWRF